MEKNWNWKKCMKSYQYNLKKNWNWKKMYEKLSKQFLKNRNWKNVWKVINTVEKNGDWKNAREVINISHDSDLAIRVINLYGMVTSLH